MSLKSLAIAAFDASLADCKTFLGSHEFSHIGIFSDEVCFQKNKHLPQSNLDSRIQRIKDCGYQGQIEVLRGNKSAFALSEAIGGDLFVPAADLGDKDLPAQAQGIEAAFGMALTQSGTLAPQDPVKAEFDEWLHYLLAQPANIDLYHNYVALFLRLLDQAEIPYFSHAGTSLGMIRNGGFIPWDDDVDLMVMEEYEDKVLALMPLFESYGIFYNEKNDNKHFYQFYIRRADLPLSQKIYLPIDIFIGHIEDHPTEGKIVHHKSPTFRQWFPKNFINLEDLYPLRPYAYGPLQMMGIKDYSRYHMRSRYAYDEAIVMRHQDFENPKKKIPYFTENGLYPIRELAYLKFQVPYNALSAPLGPCKV